MDAVHYRFGHFVLQPDRRCLTAAGVPVSVSARAFDLLTLLVEHRDRVVTKDEILASVWSGSLVEENNLAVQVSALRRALGASGSGDPYIMTVPGRGYRFVAPLREDAPPVVVAPPVGVAAAEPASVALRRRQVSWRWLAAPALVVLVLTGVAAGLLPRAAPPRLSIVVLPFRNLDGDPRQDYRADAISDDISTDLSQLPGSVVIARESAGAIKDRTAKEIGPTLGVRYLLAGSLLQEDANWQVNAQLIDAADGHTLWAQRFDVAQDAFGTARNDIVRQLAVALDFKLVQIEAARSRHDRPHNENAVDDYLRARAILDEPETLENLGDARDLLEKAVIAVPDYADAQALLAIVLLDRSGGYDDPDEVQDRQAAKCAVRAALAVAPRDPMVITARGMLRWINDDCRHAEGDFRLALSLDRSNIITLVHQAACMRSLGQMSAMISTLRSVIGMDPASARTPIRNGLIGLGLLMLGQPGDALTELKDAEQTPPAPMDPSLTLSSMEWNHVYLIAASWLAGDKPAAFARYDTYKRLWPHRSVWQLASYDTRARAGLTAYPAYLAALHGAGMPIYADENADMKVPSSGTPLDLGAFDPTPLVIPGAQRVDTDSVAAALAGPRPARLLDVANASAVVPRGGRRLPGRYV